MLVYAADRSAAGHERCRELLVRWRAQATPWHLTWGIVYELLRVVTHPRVFRRPWPQAEAWSFIGALLAAPALELLVHGERHTDVLSGILSGVPQVIGNLVHDAHTVALMREHGVRVIYTRDTDFHRFPDLEVRDPLQ